MIVNQNFIISEDYFPDHVCHDIIQSAKNQQEIDGVIQKGDDKKVRNSRVTWLKDKWIYDWIEGLVYQINQEQDWNFILSAPEDIQFTKYQVGQFYGWHQDVYENLPNGLQRKISVVVPLVDSKEYEGGDLQFYNPMENPNKSHEDKIIKLEKLRIKGSAIIFPSYIYHQVTPVTKGERLSIVIWFNGEKWK